MIEFDAKFQDDRNNTIDYLVNFVPKGRYKVTITFTGKLKHATDCEFFYMEYTIASKVWYENILKQMQKKISPTPKFDFKGVYYLQSPNPSGKMTIPVDYRALKDRYAADT